MLGFFGLYLEGTEELFASKAIPFFDCVKEVATQEYRPHYFADISSWKSKCLTNGHSLTVFR